MPPRKPLSSRASNPARRGGKGADPDTPQPWDGPAGGPPGQRARDPDYQTGSDYAVPEDEEPQSDLQELATSPGASDEDIYGEDDPYPDDDWGEVPAAPGTGEVPRAEQTRVAPILDDDEPPDEDDENATRAGPPIHLEVTGGPDEGKTRRFRGVRMVIGRTHGCDFKLSDNSVSRRHLELVLGDDGVLLRDLGSGNGTKVNGEKVNERLLVDGDEIAIGQTRFLFVDELVALQKREAQAKQEEEAAAQLALAEEEAAGGADAAPDDDDDEDDDGPPELSEPSVRKRKRRTQAPAPETTQPQSPSPLLRRRRAPGGVRARLQALSPRDRRILFGAAGGAGVLILLLVVLATRTPPPPPPDPRLEQATLKMQEARTALSEQRFEEAVTLIEQAERLSPGVDAQGLLPSAREELQTQRGFEEVRALIRNKAFDEAKTKLAGVAPAVVLGEKAKAEVEAELEAAVLEDTRARIAAALAELDPGRAEALIATLPRSEAWTFQARLDEVKAQLQTREAEAAREARVEQARAQARAEDRREAHVDRAFAAVERKFNAKDFSRAVLECDHVLEDHRGDRGIRARARSLKKLIPRFAHYYEEAQKKLARQNLGGAARPLRTARKLYKEIGFSGPLGRALDQDLAAAALVAGKAALARNDLASAVRSFGDALSLNPGETRAKEGMQTAYKRAEEMYLQGYIVRDRDPREAADKFRIVMDVMPKDTELYQKAQTQLGLLGPTGD